MIDRPDITSGLFLYNRFCEEMCYTAISYYEISYHDYKGDFYHDLRFIRLMTDSMLRILKMILINTLLLNRLLQETMPGEER